MGSVIDIMKVGDVVFESIFGILNTMISALTGGIVTEFLGGDATVEEMSAQIMRNLRDRTVELIEDASDHITKATTGLTNAIAKNFADVIGLTALQESILRNFEEEIEARIGLYEKETELVETEEAAAAKALSERLVQTISDRSELYMDQYNYHMARIIDLGDEESREFSETSLAGLEMAKSLLAIDYRMIDDIAEERNVAAVIGMATEIEESIKSADEWALEVGIKPLAYGEMAMNVFAQAFDMTPEEVQDELTLFIKAGYEAAGSLIPTFKPGVE